MNVAEIGLIWLGAIISFVCVSYMFKRTIAFKFVERLSVGAASGYVLLVNLNSIQSSGIQPLMKGDIVMIIPIILGFLLWARFIPKIDFLTRYSISIAIGIGLGLMLGATISGQIIGLVMATINDVLKRGDAFSTFNSLIILIGVLASLSHFIYTKDQTEYWGIFTKIGVLFMYVLFGSAFAGQYLSTGMERTLILFEYLIKIPLKTLGIII